MKLLKIKDLFNFEKGSLQSTKCTPGKYTFITASSNWKTHNKFDYEQESLIVAVAASGSLGRVHYVNGKFISSDLCFVLTPKNNNENPIDLKFYYSIFKSLKEDLVKRTATGTSKLAINQTNFGNYEIPYYSFSEQKELAPKFDKISEKKKKLLNEIKKQREFIQKLKHSILQDAIEGRLTKDWRKENPDVEHSSELLKRIKKEKERLIKEKKIKKEKPLLLNAKEETPFKLPTGWIWSILDEVTLFKNGKAHEQFIDVNGEYILINSKFVSTKGRVVKRTGKQMMPMYTKEIAIVMSDVPNGRALSKCFMVDVNDKYSLNQRVGGITSLTGLYHHYLFKILDRNDYYLSFNDGKKQTNLKKTQIMSCPIPLPPFAEQKEIVEQVDNLMKKVELLGDEIKKSEQDVEMLMQSVLKEAFKK